MQTILARSILNNIDIPRYCCQESQMIRKGFTLTAAVILHGAIVGEAGTVVTPLVFRGEALAFVGFDVSGSIGLGSNVGMRGTANVLVTLASGQIEISEVRGAVDSETWSGSGTFVNPNTFETVNVSAEIITDPTSFTIFTSQSFPLSQNGSGGLVWDRGGPGFQGQTSLLSFSGTFALTGPTERVTGTFSHLIGSREIITSGLLQSPGFPEEIELSGGIQTLFPDTLRPNDLVLVNETVDGIPISISTSGIRSGMGAAFGNRFDDESTTFFLVPEPATSTLALAGMLLSLRRRRESC